MNSITRILMLILTVGCLVVPAVWAQEGCSEATLAGRWGYTASGFVTPGPDSRPIAVSGWFTADGAGTLAGKDVTSLNGLILHRPFSGTYTVRENCTGTAALKFATAITAHLEFTIVAGGSELTGIGTDLGTVLTGYAKKQ